MLFPFGYGLSYTTYSYSDMKVTNGNHVQVTFKVKKTGSRAGAEVVLRCTLLFRPAQRTSKGLVGWGRVKLNPGESKEVTVDVEPLFLSIFNV